MPVQQFVLIGSTWRDLLKVHDIPDVPPPPPAPRAGSLPLGEAVYAIPTTNKVFLSKTGNDSNNGSTESLAKATLTGALAACGTTGWTVVVMDGVYEMAANGGTSNVSKSVIIQNYPGAVVWFDGSKRQTDWSGTGPWTAPLFAQFDHTVPGGYSGGIEAAWPMAVWPDMVHVDDDRLKHRPNTEVPAADQFTLDYTANTVKIGTNPSGKVVRLSAIGRFGIFRGANTKIRGIGIRRFATTLTSSTGTVDVSAPGFEMENCVLEDCGQQGLALGPSSDNATIKDVTLRRSAQLNFMSNGCDNLLVANVLSEQANFNLWKNEPGAGAYKFARLTNSKMVDSIARQSQCNGVWFDVSCRNVDVVNVLTEDLRGPSFEWEISKGVRWVNCRSVRTGTSGFWALDGSDIEMWNCYVDRGSAFDLRFEEDNRAGNVSAGENPDGTQDWRTNNITVCNTVLANSMNIAGVWRLYFANIAVNRDMSTAITKVAGNLWSASNPASVSRMYASEKADGSIPTYTSTTAAQTGIGAGKIAASNKAATFTTPSEVLLTSYAADAEPLPAHIAALIDVPAGYKAVGPIRPAPIARSS